MKSNPEALTLGDVSIPTRLHTALSRMYGEAATEIPLLRFLELHYPHDLYRNGVGKKTVADFAAWLEDDIGEIATAWYRGEFTIKPRPRHWIFHRYDDFAELTAAVHAVLEILAWLENPPAGTRAKQYKHKASQARHMLERVTPAGIEKGHMENP